MIKTFTRHVTNATIHEQDYAVLSQLSGNQRSSIYYSDNISLLFDSKADIIVSSNEIPASETYTFTLSLNVICNTDGSIRWMQPVENKHADFLNFYAELSTKAKLFGSITRTLFKLRVFKFHFKKVINIASKSPLYINELLNELSPSRWSLFTGTVGVNRKLVVYAAKETGDDGFLKIPLNESAKRLTFNEKLIADELSKLKTSYSAFVSAKTIGSNVYLSNVKKPQSTRSLVFGQLHYKAVKEWYTLTKRSIPVKSSTEIEKAKNQLSAFQPEKNLLFSALQSYSSNVLNSFRPNETLVTAFAHKDFTPWNIFINEDKLGIYDVEMSNFETPILFDIFHFQVQKAIMIDNFSTEQTSLLLEDYCKNVKVRDLSELYNIDPKRYYSLYLALSCSYYLNVYSQQEKLHQQAQRLLQFWLYELSKTAVNIDKTDREAYVIYLQAALQNSPVALIKNPGKEVSNLTMSSDIDLAVKKNQMEALVSLATDHNLIERFKCTERSYMQTIELYFKDGGFLRLDFLHSLKVGIRKVIEFDKLIDKRVPSPYGFDVLHPFDQIKYLLAFYFLNGAKMPEKYIIRYQEIDLQMNGELLDEVNRVFVTKMRHWTSINNHKRAFLLYFKREHIRLSVRKPFDFLRRLISVPFDIIAEKGVVISFSGVDGAGKSTVLYTIKDELETLYRKQVVVLRHRPSIFPILSAIANGKEKAELKAASTLPRQGTNTNYFSSLARFAYYLTDFLIGQWIVYFKYTLRGKVVLFDRYYFDFIVDGRRSNIHLPSAFTKSFLPLISKPDFNAYLYASPEMIRARKQELEIDTISQLDAHYKSLFGNLHTQQPERFQIVENDKLALTLSTILKQIRTKL
jgi:thymidylate kinase